MVGFFIKIYVIFWSISIIPAYKICAKNPIFSVKMLKLLQFCAIRNFKNLPLSILSHSRMKITIWFCKNLQNRRKSLFLIDFSCYKILISGGFLVTSELKTPKIVDTPPFAHKTWFLFHAFHKKRQKSMKLTYHWVLDLREASNYLKENWGITQWLFFFSILP